METMQSQENTKVQQNLDALKQLLKILDLANDMVVHPGKVVFVVGAGASRPVGVPLSNELREELVSCFEPDLDRTLRDSGMPGARHATLEQVLSAYLEITQEKSVFPFLKPKIPAINDRRFPPLGYEILSHFVICGLVRYIISLNFDELLEKSLDSNVGKEDYEKIQSRSAFGRLVDYGLMQPMGSFEMKALFKPHGTISYPMTLRPTFQTTQQLEDNKYEVLKTVLENASGIIFVGFSFADKDMQKVFLQAVLGRAEKPSIYFVDKGRNIVRNPRAVALVSLLPKKLKTSTFRNIQHKNFIKMDSDDFFRKLAKALFEPQNFLTEIAKKKRGWMAFFRKGKGLSGKEEKRAVK